MNEKGVGAARRQISRQADRLFTQLLSESVREGRAHLQGDTGPQEEHQGQDDAHDLGADTDRAGNVPELLQKGKVKELHLSSTVARVQLFLKKFHESLTSLLHLKREVPWP